MKTGVLSLPQIKQSNPFLEKSRKVFAPKSHFKNHEALARCAELFSLTTFAFKQSLHLCSVSNLRIVLFFQLRTFKVGFSGPKTFRGFRETGLCVSCSLICLSHVELLWPTLYEPFFKPGKQQSS